MRRNLYKAELAQAALEGITRYLASTRGSQFFRNGRATIVPGTYTVQVEYKLPNDNRLLFFELTPKGGL